MRAQVGELSRRRSVWAFIARSSSGVTCCIRMRPTWTVKRSCGRTCPRMRSMAGISVSIVVLELGTMSPTRYD
jgi:hypothetical protein